MVNMQVPTRYNNRFTTWFQRFVIFSVILCVLSSCTLPTVPTSTTQPPTQASSPTAVPQETLITFQLTLGQPLPAGESASLTILDEVSGLAFNPTDYVMTSDDAIHLTVILPFQLGSVIKYRYTRHGTSSVIEHQSNGQPVRYRIYHVEGPGVVQDTLSRWTDTFYTGNTGRITGQITDSASRQPIPNLLITAGGAQAFTKGDGSYLIDGLPEGIHNLVAYAIDGMYQTYQQGAIIAANSTTPASFSLSQNDTVPVVFSVTVPTNTPAEAPLRLAGNLYQLGNTFADLSGGVSTLASRMPVLNKLPDGHYETVINLPTGAYIEYKYTLGDGLWNAEHNPDGALITRRFIVPSSNSHMTDTVSNWGRLQVAPITFDVTVPAYTPASEGVSIQFNPGFGWLQPLPMWSASSLKGQSIWRFILISPLEVLETIQYRICRADQCGIADDRNTRGTNPVGNIVNTGGLPQTIIYTVSEWAWYQSASQQASIPNVSINSHGVDFIAGISFDSYFHPSWGSHVNNAIEMVRNLGANWLILSPTWSLTSLQTPVSEILPSQDIFWADLSSYITRADNLGLEVGIYPALNFPLDPDRWWQDSPRDFSWWVIWFEHYTQFILHHAEIARQLNVEALIMGGDWVSPALPHGTLVDGSLSEVPADAEYRWRAIIDQIRERYSGTLIWVLSYPEGVHNPPAFIEEFDKVIINWSAPLSDVENPSVTELYTEAARILDQEIKPISQSIGKPIILAVMYPSADGSSSSCITASNGTCVLAKDLSTTNPETAHVNLDLQEQADLYNSLFLAVNEREWITGLISVGFFPPVALHDPSLSIYDKPAGGVLWYWFPRLQGNQP
jgi:hypothetical protein